MTSKKVKILIVEDERSLADVLFMKLKKEGYDTEVAYDGQAGYEKIISWQPDMILLDIVMPRMDGYEVMEKMQEENIKIPVIIISNSGQPVEIEKTKKLGAIDHLIKTEFDPSEVIEKVNKYLSGQGSAEKDDKGIGDDITIIEPTSVGEADIKILLVEDDSFLREICAKKLSKEGFTVYEAIDGEKALQNVEKIKPDLILLDIILPSINGFEVLEKIKANSDDSIKNTPVIMLSNLGQDSDIEKAMQLGANNYLVKAHFTTDEIIDKIRIELSK